jgi:hypothetical protein
MSDHVRKQIRDRFVVNLTGLTTTGTNAFNGRLKPLQDTELPGLVVYTDVEESEGADDATAYEEFYDRRVTVTVEGYAKVAGIVQPTLDLISTEVETAVGADPYVNELARFVDYQGATQERSLDGEKEIGMVRIAFLVGYFTSKTDPTTAI